MGNFWTISLFWGLALLFLALVLFFILPPLLRRDSKREAVDRETVNVAVYRDQLAELKAELESGTLDETQYEAARHELVERLSEDAPQQTAPAASTAGTERRAGFALLLGLPVAAIALYMWLGNPQALLESAASAPVAAVPGEHDPVAMIGSLEARLKTSPDDAEGWFMLARSYATMERFADSANALGRVVELVPPDARLLADYADVLAMAQGRNLQGKPMELIAQALELDPDNQKALNLAASAAYQRQDFAEAVTHWRRLLRQLPPDSEVAAGIAATIQDIEGRQPGGEQPRATQAAASVSGTVTLAPSLRARVQPTDTVFVFAQAANGGRMPLAIAQVDVARLPYRFSLDDSQSMAAGDKLSNHAELVISARVSKSGQAMPRSGDLQGRVDAVRLGSQDVAIVIDSAIP
jgi:cytochrome c-type biogenesis protein CcmH